MRRSRTDFIVKVGVFSAIAFVLQVIGSLMGIKVAGFLEVEVSDLPAIIISFAVGPWAGVCVELIKNLLHCMISSTGFVGEAANFAVNGVFVLVCGMIYKRNRTKNGAVIALAAATVVMSAAGILTNLYIMLPLYMPAWSFAEKISFIMSVMVPFNLCRGAVLSVITMLIYKKISTFLKR